MGARTGTYPEELPEVVSLDNDDTILIVRGNNIFTASASILATGGITVENVLTSDSETNALSAAQGKALNTALSSKAALASPAFSGTPTAPTAAAATDNNEIATTAFVHDITDTIITSLGDKCPLVDGKVPSANLPSYVLEFANLAAFPVTGESGIIYLAIDTNLIYRWTGSAYVLIGDGTSVDVVGVGASSFVRYDVAQTLSDDDKARVQTTLGMSIYALASSLSSYLTSSSAASTYLSTANSRYQFVSDPGTTYTVPASAVTANGNTIIELSNNSLTSITINTSTATGKTAGDSVTIHITGTYAAQLLVASGVTLNGTLGFSANAKIKTLIYRGSNTWTVLGG